MSGATGAVTGAGAAVGGAAIGKLGREAKNWGGS